MMRVSPLAELIATAKELKRLWPNSISFVVGWMRFDNRDADVWQWMQHNYGFNPELPAFQTFRMFERTPPTGELRVVWLRKQPLTWPDPTKAADAFSSLAADIVSKGVVKTPFEIDTLRGNETLGVLFWAVAAISEARWNWTGPCYRRPANEDSDQWTTDELPCVFDAVVRALELQPGAKSNGKSMFMSAQEIADYFGLDPDATRNKLKRYSDKYPDCYIHNEARKHGEPNRHYRVEEVERHLLRG